MGGGAGRRSHFYSTVLHVTTLTHFTPINFLLTVMRVIHVMKSAPSPRIIIFHSVMHVIRGMHDKHVMSPITVRRFIGGQGVRLITYITYITRITCITLRIIMTGVKGVGLKTRIRCITCITLITPNRFIGE